MPQRSKGTGCYYTLPTVVLIAYSIRRIATYHIKGQGTRRDRGEGLISSLYNNMIDDITSCSSTSTLSTCISLPVVVVNTRRKFSYKVVRGKSTHYQYHLLLLVIPSSIIYIFGFAGPILEVAAGINLRVMATKDEFSIQASPPPYSLHAKPWEPEPLPILPQPALTSSIPLKVQCSAEITYKQILTRKR